MLPRVTISVPGVLTVEPGTTRRGWPRTIVPGRIVSVAPLFTKIGGWRIDVGLVSPQVVSAMTSARLHDDLRAGAAGEAGDRESDRSEGSFLHHF